MDVRTAGVVSGDPKFVKTDDQMVGMTVVMPLSTFKKLVKQTGEEMGRWSSHIIRLIEKAPA